MIKSQIMEILDTTKLRTFVTIAEEKNFSRAAYRLNLTQPTASQQIASLEKTLGVKLIDRLPRTLRLTPAGENLLEYGYKILSLCDDAIGSTLEKAGKTRRTLRLGVGHTLAIYVLPNLMHQLQQLEPSINIHIQSGNTADLLVATAEGQVELALVGSPAIHSKLQITPFMDDELIVIASPQDEWQNLTQVSLAQVKSRTLITRKQGSALHASVSKLLGAAHLTHDNVITLDETEAIKRSVEAGLGIALIQGIAVERELAQKTLKSLVLNVNTARNYNVVQRKNYNLSLPGQLMMQLLLKNAQLK